MFEFMIMSYMNRLNHRYNRFRCWVMNTVTLGRGGECEFVLRCSLGEFGPAGLALAGE